MGRTFGDKDNVSARFANQPFITTAQGSPSTRSK